VTRDAETFNFNQFPKNEEAIPALPRISIDCLFFCHIFSHAFFFCTAYDIIIRMINKAHNDLDLERSDGVAITRVIPFFSRDALSPQEGMHVTYAKS